MADYEYDVALSFLAQDERIARRLADVIGDRIRVFVQTAQQRERPDDDVIETSSSTIRDAARVCVVLYREPWGETELTGAEQRALQERAIARGWDFLLVVALASTPEKAFPVWVPRANVWLDYERYGAEGAAAVIEHKVREQGGSATQESATERGARLQRQAEAEHERDTFLDSERGVEAAQAELAGMFAAFKAESDAMRWSKSPPDIYAECRQRQCAVRTPRAGIAITWQLSYGNTLHRSGLRVRIYDRPVFLDGQYRGRENDPVAEEEFAFTRALDGRLGWATRRDPARVWSTEQLVQQLLKRLLAQSQEPRPRDDERPAAGPARHPPRPEGARDRATPE